MKVKINKVSGHKATLVFRDAASCSTKDPLRAVATIDESGNLNFIDEKYELIGDPTEIAITSYLEKITDPYLLKNKSSARFLRNQSPKKYAEHKGLPIYQRKILKISRLQRIRTPSRPSAQAARRWPCRCRRLRRQAYIRL